MGKRKQTKKYYFSVEGETEHWYLKWLQDLINATEDSAYKVSIDCPVKKNPLKHAKSLVVTRKTEIYHFFDYESDEEIHEQRFKDAMDQMKKVKSLGKQITYKSGYSNFTFDLWIILHMIDCNASYVHRKQYITAINRGYSENFQDMNEYKKEDHFKQCLKKLQLSHVIHAIERAKSIQRKNEEKGYILQQYKGYTYYKENPSLMAWEAIEKILGDCKLI